MNYINKYHESDVQVFRNKTLFAPSNYEEMIMQITTYNIVIGVLFGEKSILYKEIEKMIDHMDDNKTEYKKLGNDTNKFFVQVLFKMDLLIQQLLESCKSAEKFKHVKFGFFKKELKTMRNAIIGRSFSCSLPA